MVSVNPETFKVEEKFSHHNKHSIDAVASVYGMKRRAGREEEYGGRGGGEREEERYVGGGGREREATEGKDDLSIRDRERL